MGTFLVLLGVAIIAGGWWYAGRTLTTPGFLGGLQPAVIRTIAIAAGVGVAVAGFLVALV